jgi:hypothetical protein
MKLNNRKGKFIFKDWPNYNTNNSSTNDKDSKGGIILLLKKSLENRKINLEMIDGHVIKFDLIFKKNKNIRIIAIYNPNADKHMTATINKKLEIWIKEASRIDHEIIVMGDFNEASKKTMKQKPLIKNLQNHDLFDIHKFYAGKEVLDTWKSGELSSRIDYIFFSKQLMDQMLKHEVMTPPDIATDHKALTVEIKLKEHIKLTKYNIIQDIQRQNKNIILEDTDWSVLAKNVEEDLIENIDTQNKNKDGIWSQIAASFKKCKDKIIKDKKEQLNNSSNQEKEVNLSEHLVAQKNIIDKTTIYSSINYKIIQLHKIICIIDKVKKEKWKEYMKENDATNILVKEVFNDNLYIEEWGKYNSGKHRAMKLINHIKIYNQNEQIIDYYIDIEKLRTNKGILEIKERYVKFCQLSDNLYEEIINNNIELNIKKREIHMEEDIGTMLNRILEKSRGKIELNSLLIKQDDRYSIETNKEKIKQMTASHFKEWTRLRDINTNIIEQDDNWKKVYEVITDVDDNIYKDLMKHFTIEELNEVLQTTKNNKAPGNSGIPYDYWKKSGELTRNLLLTMINEC